jgi:hypothetical protein
MKKLFAVLLALGLIAAFAATASAVDVKFSGSYYVVGVYDDNSSLREDSYSRAYLFQRIRIQPVFQIAEGLTFTARMDALEQNWQTYNKAAAGNFDWERGYVTFKTGIGQFDVGYMSGGAWGTLWADNEGTRARVKLTTKAGPLLLVAIFEKNAEGNKARTYPPTDNANAMKTDADFTAYYLAPLYPFKGGIAGILYGFIDVNSYRPVYNFKITKHILYPYFKATFGPLYVEAELNYIFGKQDFEPAAAQDIDYEGWGAYVMAKTNMGPATVGAQIGWSKGDVDSTDDTDHTGPGKGADWNPALILMNDDLATWSGGDLNTSESANSAKGLLLLNVFANYKVTPKMSMGAALTYAKADKVPAGWDKTRGTEIDVTATYKLYDNLSYMVGAGYLWAGDYYKSGVDSAKVDNDYILMNQLTLTF